MKKVSKPINIFLWVLQVVQAFYFAAGGIYMVGHYKTLASAWASQTLPQSVWTGLGVLQILFALGLVLPVATGKLYRQIAISAIGLIIISLLGIVLYATYTGPGVLWAAVPAIFLAFIAYKRWQFNK